MSWDVIGVAALLTVCYGVLVGVPMYLLYLLGKAQRKNTRDK